MWNREEGEDDVSSDSPATRSESTAERSEAASTADQAVIGNSIRIQGEVTGDEDLTIQGYVDGSVNLDQHAVTVGPDGEVDADIVARVITVEGEVTGDLTGEEQVIVRSSARVEGDITAPRVVLEDGAHFRGGVDMDESAGTGGRGTGVAATSTRRASGGGRSTAASGEPTSDEDDGTSEDDSDDESST